MDFINNIIRYSLRNRLMVLIGTVLIIVGGIICAEEMDVDVFPDLTAPTVVVMTDAHGLATEEVERLVTFPIETAVNGATGVRRVRSSSNAGYSFVWVEFDWGTDIYRARQIVSEKMVTLSSELPDGVVPEMAPQSSIMGEILFVGMQADTTSMMELRTLADWVVKPAILATGGVSQVTIIGGDLKQYQILADPQLMNAYGVSMKELESVCRSFGNNSSGGVVRDYGNEYAVRGITRTNDVEEMGRTLIKTVNGNPILVSDVADVVVGSAKKMGHGSHNATPSIILSISKQPNVNTLEVTEDIEKTIAEIESTLPKDVRIDSHIFRQADFIEASVNNVGRALLEGALFVIFTLFLFLGSYRTTIISVLAIPLSLLATMIVLHFIGMDINTMTLGGMCIAIGSLVDDAIIDVENVYKRLRQNKALPVNERQTSFTVVFEASKEIRASILNATFIIIVAFIPLFFLSGMEGRMLKPLGVTYIISLFMSLIVAMTVTPLLSKILLADEKYLNKNVKDSWLSIKLSSVYSKSLVWAIAHGKSIVVSAALLFVVSLLAIFTMGQSFLPEFNEGALTISAVAKPGVSLDVNSELGNMIEQKLLTIPEVTSTSRRTGRGELDEHSQATYGAEIDVNFSLNNRNKDEFLEEVRHKLAEVPGVVTTVGQPLGHRIDHILSGTRANIAIKIFGTELSKMFEIGNKIKYIISDVEGIADVSVEQQIETPQLQLRANRGALAHYGISIEEFNRFVSLAFAEEKLAEVYENERSFDLVLMLNKNYTDRIDDIKSALIDTGNGGKIPVEEVADIVSVGGPNTISRENVRRKLVVSANVAGGDQKSVVDGIRERINSEIVLPEGYMIEYGGQFESAQNATRTLIIASAVALFVIFLLLYGEFRDVSLSAIVLLNLPLALIGGVMAVKFSSDIISIPSIIGFITLFGIATRNGILLISKYLHSGGIRNTFNLHETVLKGSVDRLNPILMTALTAALALIPLVFNGDEPGNEIQSPMAIVVLGGLITSTLLNIYVVPIIYIWFHSKKNLIKNRHK